MCVLIHVDEGGTLSHSLCSATVQLPSPPSQQALDVETETCTLFQQLPFPHHPLHLCLCITYLSSGPSFYASSCSHPPIIPPLVTQQAFNRLCEPQSPLFSWGRGKPHLPRPFRSSIPWVLGDRRARQPAPRWLSCAEGNGGRKQR